MTTAETTTAAARFLADAGKGKGGVSFDGFNRYVIEHPETGKQTHWRRATTHAGSVKDSFGLARWSRRMLAHGLAQRMDLLASVAVDASEFGAGHFDGRDCSRLDEAIEQAQEHAGSTVGATLGTTMHRFTELLDERGEMPEVVPPLLAPDLVAYRDTMAAARFVSLAIERLVCLPDLEVAGTLDRILSRDGVAYVGDLKTGKDLGYSWSEIAIQLALYAHAPWLWEDDGWVPKPEVDLDRAVVMHVPVGQGRCDLYWVDIQAGWEAATELVPQVRQWRARRGLWTPVDLSSPPLGEGSASPDAAAATDGSAPGDAAEVESVRATPEGRSAIDQDRSDWIVARLGALADSERARTLVALHWPDQAADRPPWPDPVIDAIASLLDNVEAEVGQPFGESDPAEAADGAREAPTEPEERREQFPPWEPPDDGERASQADVDGLQAALAFLDEDQRSILLRWAKEAMRVGRPFAGDHMTRRMLACARAAYACAAHLGTDDKARMSLLAVIEAPWRSDWFVGAVFGSLSEAQADRLADIVNKPI